MATRAGGSRPEARARDPRRERARKPVLDAEIGTEIGVLTEPGLRPRWNTKYWYFPFALGLHEA